MPQTRNHFTLRDRRDQILQAALLCFGKCGFHLTSMQDISDAAGISVGLIYRYFASKEEVIAALAAEHKARIAELLERAEQAPTLLAAMEILFTSHCTDHPPQLIAAFVTDLFAESMRNPRVAKLVKDVSRAESEGLARLIAHLAKKGNSPSGLDPHQIAEIILAVNAGSMMRGILRPSKMSASRHCENQRELARTLCRLLLNPTSHANGHH